MVDPLRVREAFVDRFGPGDVRLFQAPGRVNIIGEHTDYNDGFVLPVAIERNTVVAARSRMDSIVRVHSLNVDETCEFDRESDEPTPQGSWINYVEGVSRVLQDKGFALRGADLVVSSDVPDGAGLSSSAALEISSGLALASISGVAIDPVALALAGQQAEHMYVGTMCGIMDQYISALGRQDHALLIDCRTLHAEPVEINGNGISIVICDSQVKHSLASSEYNKRRRECEQALELLRDQLPAARALRDVTVEDFEEYASLLPDVLKRRARHVISENERTLQTVDALRAGDWQSVGRLMYASHDSLRDDYEVSARELDALVEIASSVDGVIGSRMTGGGFGGCTVSFVRDAALDQFKDRVTKEYRTRTNRDAKLYVTRAVAGASEISASVTA